VTLATCGSAEQGSVKIPGASLAFELHDSGIPLVVGSQFPLSVDGSLLMTESIYRGLLAGRDPRSVMWETRESMQANMPQGSPQPGRTERAAHDWASLTIYAAFPAKLDAVMPTHRRTRQRKRMDVQLRNLEHVLERLTTPEKGSNLESLQLRERVGEILRGAAAAVRKFDKWMRSVDSTDDAARVNNKGILASAQKQVGLLNLQASIDGLIPAPEQNLQKKWATHGEEFLRESRRTYWEIFKLSRNESWAVVQFLALDFALRGDYEAELWEAAVQLALLEEHVPKVQRRIWALAALLELRILDTLKSRLSGNPPRASIATDPFELASRIHDLFGEAPWDVYSAKRQFDRYVHDFAELAEVNRRERGAGKSEARRDRRMEIQSSFSSMLETPTSLQLALNEIAEVLKVFDDLDFKKLRADDELGPSG
jgi:hypothetical protein